MATHLLSLTESKFCFASSTVDESRRTLGGVYFPLFLKIYGQPEKMDKYLGISYRLAKSENFEEYMKALGIGLVTRKIGNAVTPTVKLTEENGVYTLHTSSTFKNQATTFKPGHEFDEETPDGRKVKSVVTFEGNKMIQKQFGPVETLIIREFSNTDMKATFKAGNVTCTRFYERVH